MNSLIGTALRAAVAAVTSAVRPAVWTNTHPAVNPPVTQDPFSEMASRAGHYEHYRDTIVSEMEKGRMLEWWILVAEK